MRTERDRLELIGIILLTLVAGFLRFLKLGMIPLSDGEAQIALQALYLTSNTSNLPGGDVLLVNLMAFMMNLFDGGLWVTRFYPALAGTLIVILPFLFRKKFSTKFLFFVAIWLTFDPGMVAMSRQVNSTTIAIFLTGLLVFLVIEGKTIGSGIVSGLLLLTGTTFWVGFIPFVFALLIISRTQNTEDLIGGSGFAVLLKKPKYFISLLLTLLFVGTYSFLYLGQLGGILTAFLGLFKQSVAVARLDTGNILRMLVFYQLPLLVIGVVGLVALRFSHKKYANFFTLWFIFLLILIVLLPGTSADWVLWLQIPLIIAACSLLKKQLYIRKSEINHLALITTIGLAVFTFLVLIYFNLTSNPESILKNPQTGTALIIAGIALVMLAIFLVGWALSWQVAGKSLFFIMITFSFVYTLSASWNAARLRQPFHHEMWILGSTPTDADLLFKTIGDYSRWNHGNGSAVEIAVIGISSPALQFLLRDFDQIVYVDSLAKSHNPEIIITSAGSQLAMVDSYRGQDFAFTTRPNWNVLITGEWRNWVLTRQIPANMMDSQQLIVWIRNDLFPGSN